MLSRLPTSSLGRTIGILLTALLVLPVFGVRAQDGGDPTAFKPEELEQIVAPIALYPDPLVAQVLMASTYPLEVVQAARFVKANPNAKGDQLNELLKKEGWDDSVKALVPFPQVLGMMSEKLDWTQKLGDAFLGQQKDTMDAIQRLRGKAQAQGNLKDSKEQKVIVEPAPATTTTQQVTVIKIEPADPQVVYVPTYNPTVVYGAWAYPAYPPYYWYPPGYAAATVLSFGVGMAVGASLWGGCNWGHGDVNVNVNKYNNFTNNVNNTNIANKRSEANRASGGQGSWQHNPEHRGGAQYRNTATQQKFNKTGAANPQSREAFRGRAEQGRQSLARGEGGQGVGGGNRGGSGSLAQNRGGGAFEGAGQGREAKAFSERGGASRESANRSSGGGFSRGGGGGFQGGGGGGARAGGGGRGRR